MTSINQYRDRTIGEVQEHHIGEKLRVAGWIENIRDHGGVSFIDLSDSYAGPFKRADKGNLHYRGRPRGKAGRGDLQPQNTLRHH